MVVKGTDGSRSYAPPWRLSGHDFLVEREAPAQGQHTWELLREAGYSRPSIRELIRCGFAAGPVPADER